MENKSKVEITACSGRGRSSGVGWSSILLALESTVEKAQLE